MSPMRTEDAPLPRPIVDHPSRDPADHPGRLPNESGPHPTAHLRLRSGRVHVRVVRDLERRAE